MVVANSTSTYARVNDRWLGLRVQVRTKLCGHLSQKRSIRVGMISSMKMTTDRAQQHNSTSGNRAKYYHVQKKIPLVPRVHTVDIPGNAILTHG